MSCSVWHSCPPSCPASRTGLSPGIRPLTTKTNLSPGTRGSIPSNAIFVHVHGTGWVYEQMSRLTQVHLSRSTVDSLLCSMLLLLDLNRSRVVQTYPTGPTLRSVCLGWQPPLYFILFCGDLSWVSWSWTGQVKIHALLVLFTLQ